MDEYNYLKFLDWLNQAGVIYRLNPGSDYITASTRDAVNGKGTLLRINTKTGEVFDQHILSNKYAWKVVQDPDTGKWFLQPANGLYRRNDFISKDTHHYVENVKKEHIATDIEDIFKEVGKYNTARGWKKEVEGVWSPEKIAAYDNQIKKYFKEHPEKAGLTTSYIDTPPTEDTSTYAQNIYDAQGNLVKTSPIITDNYTSEQMKQLNDTLNMKQRRAGVYTQKLGGRIAAKYQLGGYLDYIAKYELGKPAVKRKGWWAKDMQTWSLAKKKEVLNKYGKEGLTEATYKWLYYAIKNEEKNSSLKKPTWGTYTGKRDVLSTKLTEKEKQKEEVRLKQEALLAEEYDLGKWGADGRWGKDSLKAYDKAMADGWIYENGKLVKKPEETSFISTIQYATHPMFGTPLNVDVDTEGLKELKRQGTVRQYTAAQNTLEDVIKAPIKRGIGAVLGSKVANFVMPTKEYNEDHLSEELYNWLLEAIDKKWPVEERRKYFELNPDAKVKKGWHGRVNDKVKVSDYQKYYGVPYTGPVGHGIKETMFGAGLPQALGTLGSFNIVYTKDGAYIQDDWDFGVGKDFGHGNLLLVIRSTAEHLGSLENSDIEPIRKVNAFIKYR